MSQRLTCSNPVPAKKKAIPRKRKLSELSHSDAIDLPAAPATKKKNGAHAPNAADLPAAPATKEQDGAHAQNAAEGVLPAEFADDSRPEPFGKPPAWAEVRLCPSSSS